MFNADELNFVSQKGVYPYEFMDDIDKFEYPSLPSTDQLFKFKLKWYKRC